MACNVYGAFIAELFTNGYGNVFSRPEAENVDRYSAPYINNVIYAIDGVHVMEADYGLSPTMVDKFVFVPLGSDPDGIAWEYTWDVPPFPAHDPEIDPMENSFWNGYLVEQQGSMLIVTIREGHVHWSTPEWLASITATVKCQGIAQGTVKLWIGKRGPY